MYGLLIILALLVTPALAQQPDPATLQQAIGVLQAQRNRALDAEAQAELALAKAQAEIEELKKKLEKPDAEHK